MFGVEKATVSNQLLRGLLTFSPKAVSHRIPGQHNINKPLSFPENDRIVVHNTQGFEGGEEANIRQVFDFIDRRSKMPALGDQLHAIRSAEGTCSRSRLTFSYIPQGLRRDTFAGSRLFEAGAERILKEYEGTCLSFSSDHFPSHVTASVPIIVVFTKLDILRDQREATLEQELEQRDEHMEDKDFEVEIDTAVDEAVSRETPLRW